MASAKAQAKDEDWVHLAFLRGSNCRACRLRQGGKWRLPLRRRGRSVGFSWCDEEEGYEDGEDCEYDQG